MIHIKPFPSQGDRSEQLLSLLLSVAESELLACRLYSDMLKEMNLSPVLIDLCRGALIETQAHCHSITECIERLNGSESAERKQNKLSPITLGFYHLLNVLYKTESFSVQTYIEICTLSLEYDYRIFDLSYRNLHEKNHYQNQIKNMLTAENLPEPVMARKKRYTL